MKGERLRALRKEHKITQQQLGDMIGVTGSTIRMIEINKRNGSIEVLSALSDFFNVSIDYLECRTEYRNSKDIATEIMEQLKKFNIINNADNITDDILDIIVKHVGEKNHLD